MLRLFSAGRIPGCLDKCLADAAQNGCGFRRLRFLESFSQDGSLIHLCMDAVEVKFALSTAAAPSLHAFV